MRFKRISVLSPSFDWTRILSSRVPRGIRVIRSFKRSWANLVMPGNPKWGDSVAPLMLSIEISKIGFETVTDDV